MSIYVGYKSPIIVRYKEPLTGDLFIARFTNCDFDETGDLPLLEGDKNKECSTRTIGIIVVYLHSVSS